METRHHIIFCFTKWCILDFVRYLFPMHSWRCLKSPIFIEVLVFILSFDHVDLNKWTKVHNMTNFCTFSEKYAKIATLTVWPPVDVLYFICWYKCLTKSSWYNTDQIKGTITSSIRSKYRYSKHSLTVLRCCVNYNMIWDVRRLVTSLDLSWG